MTPEEVIRRETELFMEPFKGQASPSMLQAVRAAFLAGLSAGPVLMAVGDIRDPSEFANAVLVEIHSMRKGTK